MMITYHTLELAILELSTSVLLVTQLAQVPVMVTVEVNLVNFPIFFDKLHCN
jgi:hypothetical protein